jgi:hypothetical protein
MVRPAGLTMPEVCLDDLRPLQAARSKGAFVKSKLSFASAVLCLSLMITGAHQGAAQQVQPLDPEWLLQMYQEGWQKVQEGVLQRSGEGNSVETFTYGEEGLQFSIQKLAARVAFLENEYNANPTEELGDALDHVRGQLLEAQGQVGTVEAEPFGGGETLENCDIAYGAHAYATSLTGASAPGVTASASAYFHNNCGYVGFTDVFAYSKATIGTVETIKSQQDPRGPSTWIDSYGTASVSGPLACYSWAWARSWSYQLNFDYYTEAPVNYNCPIPVQPPVISGPASASTDYYSPCTDVTWTVNTTSGYSYNWYIGSTYMSSGPSLTQTYCNQTTAVNVTVVRSDSQQDTHTTNIFHLNNGNTCDWDPYAYGCPCYYGGGGGWQRPYELERPYCTVN